MSRSGSCKSFSGGKSCSYVYVRIGIKYFRNEKERRSESMGRSSFWVEVLKTDIAGGNYLQSRPGNRTKKIRTVLLLSILCLTNPLLCLIITYENGSYNK